MTSNSPPSAGSTGTTPPGCTATSATDRLRSSRPRSTLPPAPARRWSESNSPSLHRTQGGSLRRWGSSTCRLLPSGTPASRRLGSVVLGLVGGRLPTPRAPGRAASDNPETPESSRASVAHQLGTARLAGLSALTPPPATTNSTGGVYSDHAQPAQAKAHRPLLLS